MSISSAPTGRSKRPTWDGSAKGSPRSTPAAGGRSRGACDARRASAEGLLITGFGRDGHGGDFPYVRARRDGTFALRVCSDYNYKLEIDDTQWSSEPWSGKVLGKDTREPAEITMNVYPATPLTIRVTRGPRRDPVLNAWVEVSSIDKGTASNLSRWLWTDARGMARTGVGKGPQKVTLRLDPWTEERTIQAASGNLVEVEFHRPWQGDRHVTGRLLLDGARYAPSAMLVAHAWTPRDGRPPLEVQPQARPDGTFEVAFDAEALSLLFVDPPRQISGFVRLGQADSTVELTMVPTATYSGTLLDEKAQPLAGHTLQLDVQTARHHAVPARRTDEAGRFRFDGVPTQVPLRLLIQNEGDSPEYDLGISGDRLFEPGEVRENDQVRARRMGPAAAVAPPSAPLAQRTTRNARLLLAEARKEAKGSGRRVWILYGGPRCAPCFRLARWMEDHHTSVEKDFVIVKVMDGVDEHVGEVIAELPWIPQDGIPWFAISEPDGTVLATSEGPLGNIGFPDSVEGIRHFRRTLDRTVRRLKSDEVDILVRSLSPSLEQTLIRIMPRGQGSWPGSRQVRPGWV